MDKFITLTEIAKANGGTVESQIVGKIAIPIKRIGKIQENADFVPLRVSIKQMKLL